MKILVIVDKFPPYHEGGYELRCKDVLDQLKKRGHTIIVITTRVSIKIPKVQDEEDVFRVLHSEDSSRSLFQQLICDYKDLKCLNNKINGFKPNLIYLWHTINFTRALYPYLADQDIPVVYDEGGHGISWAWQHHGFWYSMLENQRTSQIKKFVKRHLSNVVQKLSCGLIKNHWAWPNINAYFNSEYNQIKTENEGIFLNRSSVMNSGIDISKFYFSERQKITRPLTIITPGRITPKKGTSDSIGLIMKLIDKQIPVKLLIVGQISSKKYFKQIDELIKNKNLLEYVEFIPFISLKEISSLYRHSDFCFFPSYQKIGLSRVPLEAMASGCLVLSYGNEGSDEIIEDQKTGYLISEGNFQKAADIIEELMNDQNLYHQIIKNARLVIEENYSLEKYVNKIENFLFESIKDKNNG